MPRKFYDWPEDAEELSIDKVIEFYTNGAAGAYPDPEARQALLASLAFPDGAAAATQFGLAESGAGKLSLPYLAAYKQWPKCWPCPGQATGDCFLPGTMVRMADGSERPIEQISIGEYVVTHEGRPQRVTRVIEKDYAGRVAVLAVHGYAHTIRATPDHRFVTYPKIWDAASRHKDGRTSDYRTRWKYRSEERDWRAIGQLVPGEYVSLPRIISEPKDRIFDLAEVPGNFIDAGISGRCIVPPVGMVRSKGSTYPCNRHIAFDERLAWLLGMYLAEGSLDKNDDGEPTRITYNLNRDETVLAAQLIEHFRDIFGVDAVEERLPSKPSVLLVRVTVKPVAGFFGSLIPGNIYTKQVPWQVFSARKGIRLAMLRGWLDGDGTLNMLRRTKKQSKWFRCNSTGTSVSHLLCRGMFDLANSCGLRPTLTRRKARKQSKKASDVHLYGAQAMAVYPEQQAACRTPKMLSRHHTITAHGLAAKVKSVTFEQYAGKVHCLEVEHDHSFVAEGYAASNCVGHAGKNAAIILIGVECALQLPDETTGVLEGWPEISAVAEAQGVVACENIYGARGHGGQGANCATLQRYVMGPGGIMLRQNYPELGVDFTKYNVNVSIKWGRSGVPSAVSAEGKKHQIRNATDCQNHEVCRDFIANGYPIWVCSGLGWSSTRDENGYSRKQGGWSHSWVAKGYDDREETKKRYGFPLFLYGHDWGRWNSGGRRILGTDIDIPEGDFWADARLLDNCDCVAMSSFNGFPARDLPDYMVI